MPQGEPAANLDGRSLLPRAERPESICLSYPGSQAAQRVHLGPDRGHSFTSKNSGRNFCTRSSTNEWEYKLFGSEFIMFIITLYGSLVYGGRRWGICACGPMKLTHSLLLSFIAMAAEEDERGRVCAAHMGCI